MGDSLGVLPSVARLDSGVERRESPGDVRIHTGGLAGSPVRAGSIEVEIEVTEPVPEGSDRGRGGSPASLDPIQRSAVRAMGPGRSIYSQSSGFVS